jgi:tetratricopeptide (TPR) repeat protein
MKTFERTFRELYNGGKYKDALSLIKKIEENDILSPNVLVWKGRCLQLIDEEPLPELSEIEQTFKQALEIDNEYTPALIELAWFYLNVLDDADKAKIFFQKAIQLQKQMLSEAIVGFTKCLLETQTRDIARQFLEEIAQNSLNLAEIQELRQELESDEF